MRFLALAMLVAACSGGSSKGGPEPAKSDSFTLFVTTELRGTIEPCGCTTDPLGDLARTAALIKHARTGKDAVLYVDGGSTLYQDKTIPARMAAQETLKADLLVKALTTSLGAAALGLGPNDLARGPEAVQPPRHAANVPAGSKIALAPPEVREVGGVRVGLFGVVAPAAVKDLGIDAGDPVPAARAAVENLRRQAARIIVGIAHMPRKDAVALARAVPGIDFLVIGQGAPEPPQVVGAPQQVGDTWLVQPANRGQVVTRLEVTVRGGGALADAYGEARAREQIAKLDERIAAEKQELAALQADPSADPEFVAQKQRDIAEAEAERDGLVKSPVRVPEQGSWFTMEQVRIKKGLECDRAMQADKQAYDRAAGEANVAAGKTDVPPAPPAGEPSYVGASCGEGCHDKPGADAIGLWKQTRHAQAWETLERVNKQFNLECTSCHVTGWDQPGGSGLGNYQDFVDVGCETCHGPGSLHEDAPKKVRMAVREPPRDLCVKCHSEEHSDTFDYTAYLRDVTGPGHGAAFRTQLGDGPTGRQLRQAGLDKAGRKLGAGCLK
jgi:hypothetical protein